MGKQNKRSIAGKLLFIVSIVVALTTALSICAYYLSPAKFWWLAFFGLLFIYIYPVNFLFVIYYAMRKRSHIILPLIVAIAGFSVFDNSFNFYSSPKKELTHKIKVLSYNVRLFDLYNWTHNMETRAKIFEYLKNSNADIFCFQEYYSEDEGSFNNTDTLKAILKTPNDHLFYSTNMVRNTRHWGIIMFSKYKILNEGYVALGKKADNTCIFMDVLVNADTIRVYNVHLESIRFKKRDYAYVNDIKENVEEKNINGLKAIIRRLKGAFEKRAGEVDLLAEHIKQCSYKTILCGDFNDTPSSYTFHKFAGLLDDSFKNGDAGFVTTYNGPFPAFRIDYILHSPNLTSTNYAITRNNLSDHYPVTVEIGF